MTATTHNHGSAVHTVEAHPIEALEQEHRLIQRVVAGMGLLADEIDRGAHIGSEILGDLVAFFQIFAGRCHHAKEERALFPLLESKGVPPGSCPIGSLHNEHEKGRALLAQLDAAVEAFAQGAPDRSALSSTLRRFTELYPGHMWKEDYLLLPMANKLFSEADQEQVAAAFEAIEREIGHGVHERLEQFPDRFDRVVQALSECGNGAAGPIRQPEPTASPILEFDLMREIGRLRNEPGWQSGRDSKTIVKHADFRIVLTAMRGGARIHEHHADGRISVQTISGHILMHVPGRVIDLPAGAMLALDRAIPHDVEALEDSAFLLTIAWPDKSAPAREQ